MNVKQLVAQGSIAAVLATGAIGAVHWRGHVPHDFDYWGFRVFPFWHPGFHAWGFWLFGIFIPVIVI